MSNLALKILAEFRALPEAEQREVASLLTAEVGVDNPSDSLRLLEEITAKYRSADAADATLDDAWAETILASKRTA